MSHQKHKARERMKRKLINRLRRSSHIVDFGMTIGLKVDLCYSGKTCHRNIKRAIKYAYKHDIVTSTMELLKWEVSIR